MRSAQRAMDVLELLARHPAPLEATTIARLCGIPRSSTYQLLNVLAARGFVAVDGRRRWSPGARLREIAADAPTLAQCVAVLDAFERGSDRLDMGEIARRARLHVATVERVVPLLRAEGLLTAAGGTYGLGLRLATISARLDGLERLRTAARPVLAALRDATEETANLLVRDGADALYLEQAESPRPLRHAGWVGRRIPIEVSAAGKAFGAAVRPWTVRDAVEKGVTAVACAVPGTRDHDAAISVTGPSLRLRGERLKQVRRLIVRASREVGAALAQ